MPYYKVNHHVYHGSNLFIYYNFIYYYRAGGIADAPRGWSTPQKKSHIHSNIQQTIIIND